MISSTIGFWVGVSDRGQAQPVRRASACIAFLFAFAALFATALPRGAQAALREYHASFQPSPSESAIGYTLHIGQASGTYSVDFDLGSPPASGGTIVYAVDLDDAADLYVALRAYDALGQASEYSNEIRVAAVVPEPEPDPVVDPTPEPAPDPTPEPTPEPSPEPSTPEADMLFFDDFESDVPGGDPVDWLDTAAGNALTEAPGLFFVDAAPDGGLAFVSDSTETNIHSHYTTPDSVGWWNYDYVGRMRFSDPSAGIGVTVLSDYPNSDSYLRLRRYAGQPRFMLAPHTQTTGGETCVGTTDTGIEPQPDVWYRFRFRTVDEAGATRVLARVWDAREVEPGSWQVDCLWSAWPDAAGRPGVWSMGPGRKMWDDLGAEQLATESVVDPGPGGEEAPPAETTLFHAEDFDALVPGSDPAGWLDTARRNALTADPGLFEVGSAPGGGLALTTGSRETNIHSHYVDDGARDWQDYEYSGRMQISSARSGIGVTLYSEYPDSDRYIRLRRYDRRPGFHVANHPGSTARCVGDTETGVTSAPGVWYAFRVQAFEEAGSVRVLGKVWDETRAEPSDWQIDCLASDEVPLTAGGAPGVWSMGSGAKYWDDLSVKALPTLP